MPIKNYIVLAILYFILTCFHIFASWNQSAAHVIPDEVSYLAQARYFSGKDIQPDTKKFLEQETIYSESTTVPSTENWHYYYFGYPLLVSPIYWLTDTPSAAYKGILVFNSFLLSSLFLIVFFWIRLIKASKFHTATAIAFIVSIYPAYILQAQTGWAENAIIPGFALCCLLFTHHLKAGSIASVALFSLTAGLQFTIHPRGLASTIAAILCLTGLFLVRKDRWQLFTIGLSILIAIIITTKLVANEMALMMNTALQDRTIIESLSSVLEFELLAAIIGNLLYLSLSTIGLFLCGISVGIREIFSSKAQNIKTLVSNPNTGSFFFIFLSSCLTFILGVVFLGRNETWHETTQILDYFLYGRYNEAFLSIYIALGLLGLSGLNERNLQNHSKQLNIAFWALATISFSFFLYLIDYRYLRSIHSYGLFPWYFVSILIEGWYSNAIIFFAPLLWTWLILQMFLQNIVKGLSLVGIYFFLLDISLIIYANHDL
ncbi:MAG: hypothetical protein ABW104_16235 [Candidatus Thiodiazotropha sp. 6PLUC2]